MKVNKLKGILFDFDGVLAKTMEDNFNAWKMAMKDYGVKIKAVFSNKHRFSQKLSP